jgi:hypothetical protein
LDIVLDVLILENTDAYKSLEENLRKIGFDNAKNKSGQKQNWRSLVMSTFSNNMRNARLKATKATIQSQVLFMWGHSWSRS